MTTYKGAAQNSSQNLYWTRGNMLASGNIKNNKAFSYKYDPSNLRYSKTVNGVETLYYWDDGVLLGERTGDNFIQYIYDADGIAGMRCNDTYYYFEKNLFGDVLRVYSVYGSVVAEFKYDSYGNIISSSGSMADKVKFRYRGYYYDDETGFYYLQSRYYDPSLCRFISADQYELVGMLSQTLGQMNLYAYCNNNPIMYTDESGEGIIAILAIILGVAGAVAGGTYFGVKAYDAGYTGWSLVGAITLGAIGGGVIGASTGMLIGMYLPEITSFMLSSFNFFNISSGAGALATVSVTGAQLAAATMAVGGGVYMAYQRKNAAPRIRSSSKKEAYEKAFYKGNKNQPTLHMNGKYGPHFHPAGKFSHWHYYFLLNLLLWGNGDRG